ncbi:MAG: carboxypeptidase-like regulatory domain-containing protein [Muribaculaceae bacterium]|nr:carboxypeptidase-like regulatory domain-containing protein [Muribaculaceae bacterium]
MKSDNMRNISAEKTISSLYIAMIAIALSFILCIQSQALSAQGREMEVDTAIFMREARELQELLVSPEKGKYSTKDNPAVELIRTIRTNQHKGDPRKLPNYSFDRYDKITLGLLDFDEKDIKAHESLRTFLDTTPYGRRQMLKVLLNERASTVEYSGEGKERKEIERGNKSQGISEMFDVGNVDVMLEELLREVDIYSNDIALLSNRFPSPLSAAGNIHYRYFIADTLDVEGTRCVQLIFMPRNPADFTFSGSLYVEVGDTTGFIRKVEMKVPRTVNLNFIDNLYIDQTYEKDSAGKRHKLEDRLNLDICLVKGTQSFTATRSSRYDNFSDRLRNDIKEAYEESAPYIEVGKPSGPHTDLLTYMRRDGLTSAEANMGSLMGELRKYPLFYWGEKALVVLVTGYIKTSKRSKVDIGPINTLISSNPIEGIRLRLGGMTTANLSPYWFASGYLAYGTRDRKWKYKASIEYSLARKKYHSLEYPINSLSLTHMYDLDMIGQHYLFTNPDNVFLSLKRSKDMLVTYRHLTRLQYTLELNGGISFSAWGQHIRQDATEWLPFVTGTGRNVSYYRRTTIGASVRWAPGERFVQEKSGRIAVNRDAPVFNLLQEWGPKGIRGCHYVICKTELSAMKRFWFSSFGYLDALVKGGVVWSQVPYPELLWQNANLSYTIQPESYSLMNPMEFAMDRYISGDFTYWGNGVLFNRIPIVKLAGLREVVDFKCLWGGLSNRNNPAYNKALFRFPEDANVSVLKSTPYMEIIAGIDNIFKILRIDYVWRLSYLHAPGIDRSGLRVALHFKF